MCDIRLQACRTRTLNGHIVILYTESREDALQEARGRPGLRRSPVGSEGLVFMVFLLSAAIFGCNSPSPASNCVAKHVLAATPFPSVVPRCDFFAASEVCVHGEDRHHDLSRP